MATGCTRAWRSIFECWLDGRLRSLRRRPQSALTAHMRRQSKTYLFVFAIIALLVGTPLIFLEYLERSRPIEGVWLWQFEGSMFYEGELPSKPCELLNTNGSWLSFSPADVLGDYDYRKRYPSSGEHLSQYGSSRLEAFSVRFVGHKRYEPLGTGHLGLWTTRFEVDRMIEAVPISDLRCEISLPF